MGLQSLLIGVDTEIRAAKKANALVQESHAPLFRTIDFMKIDENKLSEIFAFLISPKETHGQGTKYLKKFLERVYRSHANFPRVFLCGESRIIVNSQEKTTGLRSADIVAYIDEFMMLFENKPWASDGDDQIWHYAQHIEARNAVIIYISDDDPSENSISKKELEKLKNNNKFFRIGFPEISSWITSCIEDTEPEKVRSFLFEVKEFIDWNFMNIEKNSNPEVINLMTQHIASSFEISKNFKYFQIERLKAFLVDIDKALDEKGLVIDYDFTHTNGKRYNQSNLLSFEKDASIQFYRRQTLHIQKGLRYAVRFSFESGNLNGLFWGISRLDNKFSFDDDLSTKIKNAMSRVFPSVGKESLPWWPWYSEASKIGIPDDWGTNPVAWERMDPNHANSLVKVVVETAVKSIEALEKI